MSSLFYILNGGNFMMKLEELIRDLEKGERVLLVDPISQLNCTVGYLNTYKFFRDAEVERFQVDEDGMLTIIVKDIIRVEGENQ